MNTLFGDRRRSHASDAGEIGIIGTRAAVAHAVYNAIGWCGRDPADRARQTSVTDF